MNHLIYDDDTHHALCSQLNDGLTKDNTLAAVEAARAALEGECRGLRSQVAALQTQTQATQTQLAASEEMGLRLVSGK